MRWLTHATALEDAECIAVDPDPVVSCLFVLTPFVSFCVLGVFFYHYVLNAVGGFPLASGRSRPVRQTVGSGRQGSFLA